MLIMTRGILAALLVLMLLGASSCNTLRGMGQDIQRAGQKIQEWTR
jgi:predicted small secreted protein